MSPSTWYVDAVAEFLEECTHTWVHGSRLTDLLIKHGWPQADTDSVLHDLVDRGLVEHGAHPRPNHSQRAFLGLQFGPGLFRGGSRSLEPKGFVAGLRATFEYRYVPPERRVPVQQEPA